MAGTPSPALDAAAAADGAEPILRLRRIGRRHGAIPQTRDEDVSLPLAPQASAAGSRRFARVHLHWSLGMRDQGEPRWTAPNGVQWWSEWWSRCAASACAIPGGRISDVTTAMATAASAQPFPRQRRVAVVGGGAGAGAGDPGRWTHVSQPPQPAPPS